VKPPRVKRMRIAAWIFSGLFGLGALALLIHPAFAQQMTLDLGPGERGAFTGKVIQLIALMTVLSLAPGILVMVTSFTRIVVVLSILRSAIGAQGTPPNMVLVSLAMFLTAFVMAPTFEQAYTNAVRPLLDEQITEEVALTRAVAPFRIFFVMVDGWYLIAGSLVRSFNPAG
jgi:flagellar biosynthetic protein FliP